MHIPYGSLRIFMCTTAYTRSEHLAPSNRQDPHEKMMYGPLTQIARAMQQVLRHLPKVVWHMAWSHSLKAPHYARHREGCFPVTTRVRVNSMHHWHASHSETGSKTQ